MPELYYLRQALALHLDAILASDVYLDVGPADCRFFGQKYITAEAVSREHTRVEVLRAGRSSSRSYPPNTVAVTCVAPVLWMGRHRRTAAVTNVPLSV